MNNSLTIFILSFFITTLPTLNWKNLQKHSFYHLDLSTFNKSDYEFRVLQKGDYKQIMPLISKALIDGRHGEPFSMISNLEKLLSSITLNWQKNWASKERTYKFPIHTQNNAFWTVDIRSKQKSDIPAGKIVKENTLSWTCVIMKTRPMLTPQANSSKISPTKIIFPWQVTKRTILYSRNDSSHFLIYFYWWNSYNFTQITP